MGMTSALAKLRARDPDRARIRELQLECARATKPDSKANQKRLDKIAAWEAEQLAKKAAMGGSIDDDEDGGG